LLERRVIGGRRDRLQLAIQEAKNIIRQLPSRSSDFVWIAGTGCPSPLPVVGPRDLRLVLDQFGKVAKLIFGTNHGIAPNPKSASRETRNRLAGRRTARQGKPKGDG
jgi:hypothetical protein